MTTAWRTLEHHPTVAWGALVALSIVVLLTPAVGGMARLFGVVGRRMFSTWEQTTAYLSGPIDPAPLLTHRFALDEVDGAMELIKSGRCGKVVLLPNGRAGA